MRVGLIIFIVWNPHCYGAEHIQMQHQQYSCLYLWFNEMLVCTSDVGQTFFKNHENMQCFQSLHSMIIVIHNMLPSCRGHCSIAYSFIQPCTTTAQKEMWVEKLFNFINRELHFLLCITSVWYFLSICLSIHGAHLVQQITMCTLTVHCYASCIRIVCILLSSLGSLLLHLRKIAVLKNIAQSITPNKWIFYSRSVREIEDDRKL